jgi:hypothetical protein
MDNKIGETVIFTKDLHCKFSPENVELLNVYSFSKKQFDTCEDWSSDDENLFYKVPGSMWDFGNFIDNFLFCVMRHRLELQNEYSLKRSEQRNLVTIEDNDGDDLPF